MKGKHRSWRPALYDINGARGYNLYACRGSVSLNYELERDYESKLSPLLQESEINIDSRNPKSNINRLLYVLVQKLLSIFKPKGEKKELDALRIDFFRDCFGNYSLESPQCPFCPQGLECQKERFGGVQK